jgi:hypothetical protein
VCQRHSYRRHKARADKGKEGEEGNRAALSEHQTRTLLDAPGIPK